MTLSKALVQSWQFQLSFFSSKYGDFMSFYFIFNVRIVTLMWSNFNIFVCILGESAQCTLVVYFEENMWSSNLLCISHSIFVSIFCTITFILMKFYESCCIRRKWGFSTSMVIVDRWKFLDSNIEVFLFYEFHCFTLFTPCYKFCLNALLWSN